MSGVKGSCVSALCSFLLHAAHDELCDGKMLLLENERQRGRFTCDEAAPLFTFVLRLLLACQRGPDGAKCESQPGKVISSFEYDLSNTSCDTARVRQDKTHM